MNATPHAASIARAIIAGRALDPLIAADADFEARATPWLKAHEALSFHADAITGHDDTSPRMGRIYHGNAGYHLARAIDVLAEAIEDVRCQVACDHNLWDGVDNAEIPLVTTRRMMIEHRRNPGGLVAVQRLFSRDAALVAEREGVN